MDYVSFITIINNGTKANKLVLLQLPPFPYTPWLLLLPCASMAPITSSPHCVLYVPPIG